MMPAPRIVLAVVLLVCSCGGKPEVQEGTTRSDAPSPDWTCRSGTQGGFTGGGDGILVHADGRVLAWSRSTANADVVMRPLGNATREQLAALQAAIDAPELRSITLQQSGNMTTFFECLRPQQGGRMSWSWPADSMGGRAAKVPEPLRRCVETMRDIARRVQENR